MGSVTGSVTVVCGGDCDGTGDVAKRKRRAIGQFGIYRIVVTVFAGCLGFVLKAL